MCSKCSSFKYFLIEQDSCSNCHCWSCCYIYFIIFYHRNNTWFISPPKSHLVWLNWPYMMSTLLKCSFCMELNLFPCYCVICSNYVTLQMVKNFNICRHNVYEHIPMYGTWFINVICITFGVRYSLNTNLNIILSILSIWFYTVI